MQWKLFKRERQKISFKQIIAEVGWCLLPSSNTNSHSCCPRVCFFLTGTNFISPRIEHCFIYAFISPQIKHHFNFESHIFQVRFWRPLLVRKTSISIPPFTYAKQLDKNKSYSYITGCKDTSRCYWQCQVRLDDQVHKWVTRRRCWTYVWRVTREKGRNNDNYDDPHSCSPMDNDDQMSAKTKEHTESCFSTSLTSHMDFHNNKTSSRMRRSMKFHICTKSRLTNVARGVAKM